MTEKTTLKEEKAAPCAGDCVSCEACAKSACSCSELSPCPLTAVLDVIGGKWKIPILCALSGSESTRYNELKRRVPFITNTMLANSLRELEGDGLVLRRQYAEMPVRVEYSLTETGLSLLPILNEMQVWGLEHLPSALGAPSDV